MSQTLTISDQLYGRLEVEAQQRGLGNVERLLEHLLPSSSDSEEEIRRREAIDRVIELQKRLAAKYGPMPDSAELIREDRAR